MNDRNLEKYVAASNHVIPRKKNAKVMTTYYCYYEYVK